MSIHVLDNDSHEISQLVVTAFELDSVEDKSLVVPCILRLKPLPVSPLDYACESQLTFKHHQDYQKAVKLASQAEDKQGEEEPRHKRRKTEDPLEPKVPGAVLLQSMLRLPSPHNDIVLHRYASHLAIAVVVLTSIM